MSSASIGGVFFDIGARSVGMKATAASMIRDMEAAGTEAGEGFNASFSKVITGNRALIASMKGEAASATASLQSASRAAQDAAANVTVARLKQEAATAKLTETEARYEAGSAKVLTAQANAARAANTTEKALRDQQIATQSMNDATARHAAAQDAAAASTGKFGAVIHAAGIAALGAYVVGTGAAIKSAANFQTTQERLVTTANLSQQSLSAVSQGLLQISDQTGESSQALSQAIYTVSSGMVHVADPTKDAANALDILKAASQGAAQEGANVKDVSDALTTSLKDFHLPADQSANVMSKLIVAVSHGKTNLQDFSTGLSQVASQAATAHVPIDDLVTALAEMTSHGIGADQAAQNINNTLAKFAAPSQQMTDALASVGIKSSDLDKMLGSEGLTGTVESLSDAVIQHLNPATNTVLVSAFNQSQIAAKSAKEAYDSLTPSLQKYVDMIKQGQLANTVKQIEKATGLDMQDATAVNQAATAYQKSVGLNANLKSAKNNDKDYQQYMQTVSGGIPNWRVVSQLTGENTQDTKNTKKDVQDAHAENGGRDVQGWHDIQGNFNQQLKETSATVKNFGIDLGTKVLPYATMFMGALKDTTQWLMKNKTALDVLLATGAGLAGLWVTVKAGKAAWSAVESGIGGAQKALKFLVGDQESAGAFSKIADKASTAWTGIRVGAINAAEATSGAWSKLGDAKAWVALRSEALGTFAAAKAAALKDSVASAGAWVAQNARAAGSFIALKVAQLASAAATGAMTAAQWLLNLAMDANPILLAVTAVAAIGTALYEAYKHCKTFRDIVKDGWSWVKKYHDVLLLLLGPVGAVIVATEQLVKHWGTVTSVLRAGGHDIAAVWRDLGAAWDSFWDNDVKPAWDDLTKAWHAVYDVTIKPVSTAITDSWKGIKDAAKGMVDWVEQQWGRIESIVKAPAKFIIETVYDDGIVPLWNGIASVFHLGKIDKVDASKFAGGGVYNQYGTVPGYAPGRDTVAAQSNPGDGWIVPEAAKALGSRAINALNSGRAFAGGGIANSMVSPGEARLTPQGVQAIGGAPGLWALNAQYSNGRPNANGAIPGYHFDLGGIVGGAVHGVEHLGHDVAHGVESVTKMVGSVADWVADPVGKLRSLFDQWIKKASGAPDGGNDFWKAVTSVPSRMLDGAIDMIKGWFGSHPGGGQGNEPWASGAGAEQWVPLIKQALALEGFPTSDEYVNASKAQIMTESGGNPNISQQVQDVNSGGNEAQGLVQVTPRTAQALGLADLGGNIHDPLTNLRLGMRELKSQHGGDLLGTWGHGHGYAGGGIAGLTMREVLHFTGGGWTPNTNSDWSPNSSNSKWDPNANIAGNMGPSAPPSNLAPTAQMNSAPPPAGMYYHGQEDHYTPPAEMTQAAPAPGQYYHGQQDHDDKPIPGATPYQNPSSYNWNQVGPQPVPQSLLGTPPSSQPVSPGGNSTPVQQDSANQGVQPPTDANGVPVYGDTGSNYTGAGVGTGGSSPVSVAPGVSSVGTGTGASVVGSGVSAVSTGAGVDGSGAGVAAGGTGGPANAISWLTAHESIPYVYGGASAAGLDCSALVGFGQKVAEGDQNPNGRIGTTDTMLAGSWPDMIRGATQGQDAFIVGVNPEHMLMSILGTNFEERQSGETMRVGANAKSPFDPEFTAQYHLDPSKFNPPYQAGAPDGGTGSGAGAGSGLDSAQVTDLNNKITAAKDQAVKDQADAKAAQARADSDMADAQRADQQAATAKTVAQRVKYTKDAAKYRADAAVQKAAAQKYLDDAKAKGDDVAKLQNQLSTDPGTNGTGTDGSSDSLTWHDMWSRLGGVAGDAISQTTGVGDLNLESISESPLFKIGSAFAGAKYGGAPRTPSIFTGLGGKTPIGTGAGGKDDGKQIDTIAKIPAIDKKKIPLYDDGGLLPDPGPGISVVPIAKGTREPERVLNGRHTEKLDNWLDNDHTGANVHNGHLLNIEKFVAPERDQHAAAREIARWIAPYRLHTGR